MQMMTEMDLMTHKPLPMLVYVEPVMTLPLDEDQLSKHANFQAILSGEPEHEANAEILIVHFTCNEGAESENMINVLSEIGIGALEGSGILIIASLGLRNNSSVVIVASMLISPLMGPILAMVFALTISDRRLMIVGLKAESVGLMLCLIVGVICGTLDTLVRRWTSSFDDFPTHEMCDRSQISSLVYGVFVALPSGAGVALSVLGGNIGSLVGVAISASLLPPAVNCGLLFGISLVASTVLPKHNDTQSFERFCPISGNIISHADSNWVARQAAISGFISLALTVINIICILLVGIAVLKIKQVSRKNTFADKFWDDLKGHYGLNVDAEVDRDVRNSDVRRRVRQFAKDMSQINSDLNMITTNVYRYGPSPHIGAMLEDMFPSLPPKWTAIFQNQVHRSGRFEVRPADSTEDLFNQP